LEQDRERQLQVENLEQEEPISSVHEELKIQKDLNLTLSTSLESANLEMATLRSQAAQIDELKKLFEQERENIQRESE